MWRSATTCFHWAVVSQPKDARAMANYGLYHQYIEGHHYKAGKYLRRAINIDKVAELGREGLELVSIQLPAGRAQNMTWVPPAHGVQAPLTAIPA